MAKHACPNCGKWFDYEFNSWVCPKCGTVVTSDMENEQIQREMAGEVKQKHKEAATVRDFDKKDGTGDYKTRKTAIKIIVTAVTLMLMAAVAFMVVRTHHDASYHEPEPTTVSSQEIETEEYTYSTEATEPRTEPSSEVVITEIEVTSAAVGEAIKMGGYDLTITEVFEPQWQELPLAEGWKYVAVSFEKTDENGYEMYGFNGKDAYASLHDKTEGVHLMPLYESDIISYDDEETSLYMSYDMISGLSYGAGTILFLVKDTSTEFELSVFEGEGTSYSDYDINAERKIVIPVTINEQEVSTQP